MDILKEAISYLAKADCEDDVLQEQIAIATLPSPMTGSSMVTSKSVCRYNEVTQMFSVHHTFFSMPLPDLPTRSKAALLALCIAQTHPDGTVLARYVLGASTDDVEGTS